MSQPLELAVVLLEDGQLDSAREICLQNLALDAEDYRALVLLGQMEHRAGSPMQAIEYLRQASQSAARNRDVQETVVKLLSGMGDWEGVVLCRQRILATDPTNLELVYQLAVALYFKGDAESAKVHVATVLSRAPRAAAAHLLLGNLHKSTGHLEDAEISYRRVLALEEDNGMGLHNLGNVLVLTGRHAEAEAVYRRALSFTPGHPAILRHLASCLSAMNRYDEACACADEALSLSPDSVENRWHAARVLPIVYRSEEDLPRFRSRYLQRLTELSDTLDLSTPGRVQQAHHAVMDAFRLHYQGESHLEEQQIHGARLHRILSASYPEIEGRPPEETPRASRIRVGFASSLFREHTVVKLFGGWMRELDRSRFEVFGYHVGEHTDATTRTVAGWCEGGFHHLPGHEESLIKQIRRDNLQVLIFPELGMDAVLLKVAALRLAPVQMVSWGHPVTTGLPTIDIFLSSEDMEPENGDAHYSEQLVRLPGLSVCLEEPQLPPVVRKRSDFGWKEEEVVFLCCQSLFKLLPRDDRVFADILARVPQGRLVVLAHPSDFVTGDYVERLGAALGAVGILPDRLNVLPRQDRQGYLDLNRAADVFLDGLSWSGGVTTLEALASGLVPVSHAGPIMRARHTAAILTRIGVTETLATSPEDYVDLAVRLALDPAWRNTVSEDLSAATATLYGDTTAVRALEDLIDGLA